MCAIWTSCSLSAAMLEETWGMPCWRASCSAASILASTRATTSTPGVEARTSRWALQIAPQPTSATRVGSLVLFVEGGKGVYEEFGSERWAGERPTLIHRAAAPHAGTVAETGLSLLEIWLR